MRPVSLTVLFLLVLIDLSAQRIVAHRGALKWAPENTLAAFDAAIALGAGCIEMDVRQTADGVLVLMHDRTINRTTDGTGAVEDLMLADLRGLDAGSWFSEDFAGEPVPTLRDALLHVKGRIVPDIDFKAGDPEKLVALLDATGFLADGEVTVFTADLDRIAALNALTDRVKLRPPGPRNRDELVAFRDAYGVDVVNMTGRRLKEDRVRLVQDLGMEAFVNCLGLADTKRCIRRAVAVGADYVQADQLDVLVSEVNSNGRPWEGLSGPEDRSIDIQGHRGCRGHYPENTIEGFRRALDLGATTLEMDVAITADGEVVVSHEPYMNHTICRQPTDTGFAAIPATSGEDDHNIYRMTYAEVAAYDCGSVPQPAFPDRVLVRERKPLLRDVLTAFVTERRARGLEVPRFNIETKSTVAGDGVFHPEPAVFVSHVLGVLGEFDIEEKVILQSFDPRTLEQVHVMAPYVKTALLIGDEETPDRWLDRLSFTPDIISPNHGLLDEEVVAMFRAQDIAVIPWTANDPEDIRRMIDLGVDGIISDYPDRVVTVLSQ